MSIVKAFPLLWKGCRDFLEGAEPHWTHRSAEIIAAARSTDSLARAILTVVCVLHVCARSSVVRTLQGKPLRGFTPVLPHASRAVAAHPFSFSRP